jgi:hypothetical protein
LVGKAKMARFDARAPPSVTARDVGFHARTLGHANSIGIEISGRLYERDMGLLSSGPGYGYWNQEESHELPKIHPSGKVANRIKLFTRVAEFA